MRHPTTLQLSLGVSLLFHAALLGSYGVCKSWPGAITRQPENNSADAVTMTIMAASFILN
jgi:hypothetical protein